LVIPLSDNFFVKKSKIGNVSITLRLLADYIHSRLLQTSLYAQTVLKLPK